MVRFTVFTDVLSFAGTFAFWASLLHCSSTILLANRRFVFVDDMGFKARRNQFLGLKIRINSLT